MTQGNILERELRAIFDRELQQDYE